MSSTLQPYLALPITSVCNFRCPYCDDHGHGEAAASEKMFFSLEYFEKVIDAAYQLGTRRFRITGGEPFLDKRLGRMVRMVCGLGEVELTVDTNGSAVRDCDSIISRPPKGFSVVMSVDTLRATRIFLMTGGRGKLQAILEAAKLLASRSLLKRINMTLTRFNIDEVDEVIAFCQGLGVDLKLSDVAIRNSQAAAFDSITCSVEKVYERLLATADHVSSHVYSEQYGSPMKTCIFGPTKVTLKTRDAGARYAVVDVCGGCQHFPCDEGLYFVSALPDKTLTGCQLNGFRRTANPDLSSAMHAMFKIVAGAQYIPARSHQDGE